MVLKYSSFVRYILFFLTLFVIIFAIKVYINNFSIKREIANIESQIKKMEENIYFNQNFYFKYLDSSYFKYFLYHKNNLILSGEKKIKIKQIEIDNKNISSNNFKSNNRMKYIFIKIRKIFSDN